MEKVYGKRPDDLEEMLSTINNVVEVTALKYNDEEEKDFDFGDKLEPILDVINVSEDETAEDDNTKLPCGTRRPSWCGSWTPSTKMLLHWTPDLQSQLYLTLM